MTYCEEATSMLPDVSFTLHADSASNGTAACMPARAPLAHIADSRCESVPMPHKTLVMSHRLRSLGCTAGQACLWQIKEGLRLEALAAVADPGLAEVTDGAHERHACGILPSMRHTAISTKAPAYADCFRHAIILMLVYTSLPSSILRSQSSG